MRGKKPPKRVHAAEEAKALSFFAVGVEGAHFDTLDGIAVPKPVRLNYCSDNRQAEELSACASKNSSTSIF
jgi:hypothetical protein